MLRIVPIALCVLLVSEFAIAAQIKMTCRNHRGPYDAVFDTKAKTFRLGRGGKFTRYRVRRIQKHPKGYVVSGKTVRGGPDFVAFLGKDRRIQFAEGSRVFQIDKCQ
ncbi:MAG: hypothetical protein OEQ29_17250 [Alphaproteobacteria bacterium]|nr:hypothetical protein [Alphaproteobacteria bacterium]